MGKKYLDIGERGMQSKQAKGYVFFFYLTGNGGRVNYATNGNGRRKRGRTEEVVSPRLGKEKGRRRGVANREARRVNSSEGGSVGERADGSSTFLGKKIIEKKKKEGRGYLVPRGKTLDGNQSANRL